MKDIRELRELFSDWRPEEYADLPDLELYKDQVLAYMTRQQMPGAGGDELTGAMINNYIKNGELPRPNGKRYDRDHVALLTALCQLKQVLSVSEAGSLLQKQPEAGETGKLYARYCELLDAALCRTVSGLPGEDDSDRQIADAALKLAIQSSADRLAALKLLDCLEKRAAEKKDLPDNLYYY